MGQTSWFTSSKFSFPYVLSSQAGHTKSDESRWRCGRPCNKTLSIRSGWFFEGSHLSIQSVLDVTRYWSFDMSFRFERPAGSLQWPSTLSSTSFVTSAPNTFYRTLSALAESAWRSRTTRVFVRRKPNVERRPVPQQWVYSRGTLSLFYQLFSSSSGLERL